MLLRLLSLAALAGLCTPLAAQVGGALPPGGANAPAPTPVQAQVLSVAELPFNGGMVRIPTGDWSGATSGYTVQGPIAGFQERPDAPWRGAAYLETATAITAFSGSHSANQDGWTAELTYTFADGGSYAVTLVAGGATIAMHERVQTRTPTSWVFDGYYNWLPTAGFVVDQEAADQAFIYMPCHYDKAEAHILHDRLMTATAEEDGPVNVGKDAIAGLAVAGAASSNVDGDVTVAGFFARMPDAWVDGGRLGVALWQRRQLPAHPASRHFLGPETKSDGTPNPYAAEMIGTSAYEGHVTIEFALDGGERHLGFTMYRHEGSRATLVDAFHQEVAQ